MRVLTDFSLVLAFESLTQLTVDYCLVFRDNVVIFAASFSGLLQVKRILNISKVHPLLTVRALVD